MIMLSKINIALSLNISVTLKWNMKSLSSWKQEWEGGLQLSGGMVLQGKQTWGGTEDAVEPGPGLIHHTQGAHRSHLDPEGTDLRWLWEWNALGFRWPKSGDSAISQPYPIIRDVHKWLLSLCRKESTLWPGHSSVYCVFIIYRVYCEALIDCLSLFLEKPTPR